MLESIGKELKIIRIRNNLNLEEVACKMNINPETLRRYEKSSSGISIEKLEKLLDYYNVSKEIFFKNVCEYMHNKKDEE